MPNLLKRFVKVEDSTEVSTNSPIRNQTCITGHVISETDKPLGKKYCKTIDASGRRESVSLMHKIDSSFPTLTSKFTYYHDNKQLKTESSSSSSSHALQQESSQAMSIREMSEGHKSHVASSASNRVNELGSKDSYCGMQAVGDPSKASVCSSTVVDNEKSTGAIDKLTSSFDSTTHPKKSDCLSRNAEHSSCCTGPDTNHAHSHLNQPLSSEKSRGPSEESSPLLVHDESKVVLRQKISSLLTTKSDNDTVADLQSPSGFQFDLNETMETDDEVEMSRPQQSANRIFSSPDLRSEPITVVAKMGVPVGVPRKPLQFDGKIDWRTSAATSAFRPAQLKRTKRENDMSCGMDDSSRPRGLQGFDLNIAAVEPDDFRSMGWGCNSTFPQEHSAKMSSVGMTKKKPKEMERARLDLNSQCENDGKHPKSGILAIDLNNKSSIGENIHRDQPGQSNQPLMRNYAELNTAPDVSSQIRTARQANFNNDVRSSASAYWVDLSCMPAGFSHGQSQPFLVAVPPGVFASAEQFQSLVPLQSKLNFPSVSPPAFYIGPTNPATLGVSPTMLPPHVSSSQHGAATMMPNVSAGSVLATYPGNMHALESTPGGYATNMRPSFVLNSAGGYPVENRNKGAETRELLRPPGNNNNNNTFVEGRMKSVQQVPLSASPNFKRRQTEGGWDSLQLNYKHPDPWK